MLEIKSIQVCYGPAVALWDIDLRVNTGEIVCVIGPNAAGKTTLINTIAGLNRVARAVFTLMVKISLEPSPIFFVHRV